MTRATGLTVNVGLVEDHWHVQPLRLSPAPSHFAVIDRGAGFEGSVELIGLDDRRRLLHVAQDATSPSGWRADVVPLDWPSDAELTGITAFVEEGVLNVLLAFAEPKNDSADLIGTSFVVWLQSSGGGRWSELALEPELAAALSSVERTDVHVDEAGRHYVHGRTRARAEPAFFLAARAPSGAWQLESSARCGPTDVVHAVVGSPEGHAITLLSVQRDTLTFHGAMFDEGGLTWAPGPVRSLVLADAPRDLDHILGLPSRAASTE